MIITAEGPKSNPAGRSRGRDSRHAQMRVIVRKERPHPGAQLRFTDIDGHRVTCFATDTRTGQLADLAATWPWATQITAAVTRLQALAPAGWPEQPRPQGKETRGPVEPRPPGATAVRPGTAGR
jgi:hypothetical protein